MNAVYYSRVSTEEQANEGHSLDAQKEKNIEYIKNQNWSLVGGFTDPGYSGKNLKRPDMQRLLSEIKKGHINIIVVHKLDRLTRNIGDLYFLLELFDKLKIKFVSLSENIDTSTAMGRMFVFLLGIFAQWYRENLSEEVKKGMSQRVKKGGHNVTVPLFGYIRSPEGKLIVKEEEAKWVQWIFGQYLAGIGSTNIAKRLNDLGVRRNRGAKWDQRKVMMVLTNWHYIGKVHWKDSVLDESERIIVDGDHEPIISAHSFELAQRLLERRKMGMASLNSYEYVYGGIVKCGCCGASYKGKYNKRNKDSIYRGYVCSNNEKYGTCESPGISENNLTKLIFSSVDFALSHLSPSEEEFKDNEQEELKKQLEASRLRRERWQMAFGDGNIPYDDFTKLMKDELSRASEIESKIKESSQTKSHITPEDAKKELEQIQNHWPLYSQNTKKRIMQSLFQKIIIGKKNGVWSIKDVTLC